jgi:type II secretory pathway pseudopilin PulG
MSDNQSSEAGFGLIEAIVALVIISVALPAFYKAMSGAYRASVKVRLNGAALMLSRSKLDAIVVDPSLQPGTSDGSYANGLLWRLTVSALSTDQGTAPKGTHPYWLVLETLDARGRPLVKLETIKLLNEAP